MFFGSYPSPTFSSSGFRGEFQTTYLLSMVALFVYFEMRFVEFATQDRGLFRRLALRLWRRYGEPVYAVVFSLLVVLVTSNRFPSRLRGLLARLRRSFQITADRRRSQGQASFRWFNEMLLRIIAILIAFMFIAYRAYCG